MSAPSEALSALLYPRSIAVIGASSEARKAGGRRWLTTIQQGFRGRITPVSKTQAELHGMRTVSDFSLIEEPVDLAVVLVPTSAVLKTIEQCARKKVKAVAVISAGFGETGEEGRRIEAQMTELLRSAGARMLGPNSAGIFSAGGGVNCLGWQVPSGGIALITQSGNMAGTYTQYARAKKVGFASILAVGNSADLRLSELVELQMNDPRTKVVLVYCEGFAPDDGRALVDVVGRAARRVPVVILKPGASEAGRAAAKSHTGSLAGEDAVVSAALEAAGIFRASETEEAFDLAVALASQPAMPGRRIAVISDGGGHATVVSDCAGRNGLALAALSDATKTELRRILPDRAAVENPIDFAGFAESDPDSTAKVLRTCLRDPGVDGLIFAGHFGGYHLMTTDQGTITKIRAIETEAAADMVAAVREIGKPFILHTDHGERDLETLAALRAADVPIFANLEAAAKGMAALHRLARFAARPPLPAGTAVSSGRTQAGEPRVLIEDAGRAYLAARGIAVPAWRDCETPDMAVQAARDLGYPVVMKLLSARLVHKSDKGGVILGLRQADDVRRSADELLRVAGSIGEKHPRILVTGMISGGTEVIVGAKRDPHFGPVVLFGTGGVLVEAVRDVAMTLAPTTRERAGALIDGTIAGRLLAGHRGRSDGDVASLAGLVVQISELLASDPSIQEIDLNPVIVNASGAHIADVRVVVGSK